MAKLQLNKVTKIYGLPEGLLPRTGELFMLRIDPAKIYLFDAKNKQALQ